MRHRQADRRVARRFVMRFVPVPGTGTFSRRRPSPRSGSLQVRAGSRIVRQRRLPDLDDLLLAVVDLDQRADRRRVAVGLAQLVAAGLPDEEEVLAVAVRHRPRILMAGVRLRPNEPSRMEGARRALSYLP